MKHLSYAPVIVLLLNSILTFPFIAVNANDNVDSETRSGAAQPRSHDAVGHKARRERLDEARRVLRESITGKKPSAVTENDDDAPLFYDDSDIDDALSDSSELSIIHELPENGYEALGDAPSPPVQATLEKEPIYEEPLTLSNSNRQESAQRETEYERTITPPPLPTRKSCKNCGGRKAHSRSASGAPYSCDPVTGVCRKIQAGVNKAKAVRNRAVNRLKKGGAKIRAVPRAAFGKVKRAAKNVATKARSGGVKVKNGFRRVGRKIANGGRAVRSRFSKGADNTRKGIRTIKRRTSDGGKAVKGKVVSAAHKVDKTYGKVKTDAQYSASKAGDKIRNSAGNVVEKVGRGFYKAGDRFHAAAGKVNKRKRNLSGGSDSGSDTASSVGGRSESISEEDSRHRTNDE